MKNAYELEHPKRRKISFFFYLFNEDEQMNKVLDELPLHLLH